MKREFTVHSSQPARRSLSEGGFTVHPPSEAELLRRTGSPQAGGRRLEGGGRCAGIRGGWHWALLLLAALLVGAPSLRAQSFSLDWFTLDGGGGTSTGGPYTLSGSIGQADTATLSGGAFTLEGGFWSVVSTAPAPGVPTLSISLRAGVVTIAWSELAAGWVLESTPALAGPALAWTQVTQPYQDDGTNLYITLSAPAGNAFFRLHKP